MWTLELKVLAPRCTTQVVGECQSLYLLAFHHIQLKGRCEALGLSIYIGYRMCQTKSKSSANTVDTLRRSRLGETSNRWLIEHYNLLAVIQRDQYTFAARER